MKLSDFRIHPACAAFPLLEGDDLAALVADIAAQGLLQPIVLFDGAVLDGRNRLRACDLAGVKPRTVEWASANGASPWAFAWSQNGARRDLLEGQKQAIYLDFMRADADWQREVKERTERVGGRPPKKPVALVPPVSAAPKTREALAAGAGGSPRTAQDVLTVEQADPELFAAVKAGTVSAKKAATQIRHREARAKAADAARAAEGSAVVVCADWRDWLVGIEDGSTDLLLTDPPYMTDLDDVDAFAAEWVPAVLPKLRRSGRAYICTGSYPDELAAYLAVLRGRPGWTLDVLVWTYRNTLGPAPRMGYKRNWQAVFHLVGPEAPPLDCPLMAEQFGVHDVNAPDGRHGDRHHAWQKPDALAERFVRHGSARGASVIDPFAGSGTFLLAANSLGRHARGCDIDPDMVALAVGRGCREG